MLNDYPITSVASGEDYRVEKGSFYCVSLHSLAFLKRQKETYKADWSTNV